jgi:hypothetical protein
MSSDSPRPSGRNCRARQYRAARCRNRNLLKDRGISEAPVRRCEELMRETRSRIKIGEKLSEVFWTGRGVRQGCPLSPGLFNLVTADLEEEMITGRWGGGGVRLKGKKVFTFAYADDLVLLSKDEEGMVAIMARIERYLRVKGLVVNVGRSKIMRFGKGGRRKKKIKW